MRTSGALTGAALVPATSHVTVTGVPPVTVAAVACEVTRNGCVPAVVIATSAALAPPPVANRSRAVRRKCIVPVCFGRNSEKQSIWAAVGWLLAAGQLP